MNRYSTKLALAVSLLALLSGTVCASPQPSGYRLYLAERGEIPWQSLSPEEQDALRDYRGDWDAYDGNRQERIRGGAQRYLQLPPDKRRKLEQQRREYEELSPQERQRLREEYQRRRN